MSTADAMVFTMGGGWDVFDRACAVANHIEHMIKEDIEENGEVPTELHLGKKNEKLGLETKSHFFDPTQDKLDRLEKARKEIQNACLICQQVLEEM